MKLETLLQIIYANKCEEMVSLAIRIDNNIPLPYKEGDTILVSISRESLQRGYSFKGDKHYGMVRVPIQVVNMFRLEHPYLVQLPDNTTKWVSESDIRKEKEDEILMTQPAPDKEEHQALGL